MLGRIFNVDNPVCKAIVMIGKLWLLNTLWLICSLPIVTIGASTTALFYASMKLHKEDGTIVGNFFKSFKENFKQSTILFVIYFVIGTILIGDIIFWNQHGGDIGKLIKIGMYILLVPYILSSLYVFGIQAKFINPIKKTIKYSFFMSLSNYKHTIQMLLLVAVVLYLNFFTIFLANFIMLNIGFGLVGYFLAGYYNMTFEKYI